MRTSCLELRESNTAEQVDGEALLEVLLLIYIFIYILIFEAHYNPGIHHRG